MKWAEGKEGYNHCWREKEREKHTICGHILWGAYPCLGTKASSALLNGKLYAALGNAKAKWKALTHTIAALWKCLLRKAWDWAEIPRWWEWEVRWRMKPWSSLFQEFWCPILSSGWVWAARVLWWKVFFGRTTESVCPAFPQIACRVLGAACFFEKSLLWETWLVVSFPFNEMRIAWAGSSLLKLPFFQFLMCNLGFHKHTWTYVAGLFLHECGEGCHSL